MHSMVAKFRLVLFAATCFTLSGCGRLSDRELVIRQDEIVAKALKEVPLLVAFKARFPESVHFISYVTSKEGRTKWNSKSAIHGRYILHMTVPIGIDRKTVQVTLKEEPSFQLREVTFIESLPDGRQSIYYGKKVKISFDEWKRLEASGGDFKVLGLEIKRNSPVSGFSDYTGY
jgi:hypothetical protein